MTAAQVIPELSLERLGPALIEPRNGYSENTTIRIRLVYPRGHSRAGHSYRGYLGSLRIEEWVTRIYDGKSGATRLPMTVRAPKGSIEITLKSQARFQAYDLRSAPVPRIAVFSGEGYQLLDIPQWVDNDDNGKTDWLEARVESILRRARSSGVPEVVEVVNAVTGWKESFKRDCGGVSEEEPLVPQISTVCLDWDGVNLHRLNGKHELSATVLHEARHAWVHRHHVRLDHEKLSKLNPGNQQPACDPRDPREFPCMVHIQDERYADLETDAEAFASRYKHLFP